jgi:signal transduction histidine kinase
MSERKHTSRKDKHSAQPSAAKARTRTLLERYQRLIEIARDLSSTLDLDALLNRIVHAAADLSDAEQASILLYDQVKRELYFQAATNLDQPMMAGFTVPVDSSLAGWIVTHREHIIINDVERDTRHFGNVAKATNITTRTLMGVPMITNNRVIGALEAINKRDGLFTEEDVSLLTTLGSQAAVAIENARLFQQSDLIADLVHELRTPMASLSTAVHLLVRPDLPAEQRSRITEIIRDETFRVSELASSFLDLAKLESGRAQFRPEVFDLGKLLEDCDGVMRSRATEKGLAVTLNLEPNMPPIKADRDKLKQVILNLISNAIKYNNPDGTITISATAVTDGVQIAVSDTGPGISPEGLAHLFQKFYRAPGAEKMASGTGLGLAICKRIVEVHNGRISVTSQVDVGTTFTVYLPLGTTDTD